MIVLSDAEAIVLCQNGDIKGLEPLAVRYQAPAFRLAYLLSGNHTLADDIVQDSFLQAYRTIEQFQPHQPFAPWFYRIVTNLTRQYYRRDLQRQTISLGSIEELRGDESTQNPITHAESTEVRDALFLALAEVNNLQRETIILRYYLGYRDQEIAMIVGCSPGTARQRLHTGLQKLEKIIRQKYNWLINEHSHHVIFTTPEEIYHA